MAELTQISVTGGIPSGGTGEVPTLAPVRDEVKLVGTRAYGAVQRIGVASATALSTPIASTEVLLHASVKQYVLAVAGTGTPTVSASTGIPLEAGEKFHMRITSGQRIATIREDTDGFLHIAPVA